MTSHSCSHQALIVIAVVAIVLTGSSLRLAQASTAATTLEELARGKFPDLNPTELRVVQAAASGAFGRGDDPDRSRDSTEAAIKAAFGLPSNDPANATKNGWSEDRRVRADLIRWLGEDDAARKLVDPHGINIFAVWVEGVLDLSYLHINFPVNLWRSSISSGINLHSAELAELELVGSQIGENSTVYAGSVRVALNGEGLTVHGSVLLSDGFHAFGQVNLYGAKVDGQLYCNRGQFSDPGGKSLLLRLATIGGEAALDGGFSSDGLVDLGGAKIGGDLLINGATFSAPKSGLIASNLNARELDWTAVAISTIDLSDAKVEFFVLTDDQKKWPRPGHLTIDGFVYGDFDKKHGQADKTTIDVKNGLAWLNLQPLPRPAQPYEQLAKVFLGNGQKSEETKVLIREEADMRLHAELPDTFLGMPLHRVGDRLLVLMRRLVSGLSWLTFGYGYEPLFALGWIAGFVALGTFTFHWGYRTGLVVPTEHDAYDIFKDSHNPPAGYQPFNSFVYSLETFVPLIELHQVGYWLPYPRKGQESSPPTGQLLRWYLWAHIVVGWIFTSLLVAGLAGLIQNR